MSRSRGWCFTINNYDDDDIASVIVMGDDAQYYISGFEKGQKGTPHIQGYVYFTNAKSFDRIKKYIPNAHIEIQRGTPEQASGYCKKEGQYYEYGKIPTPGAASWDKIEQAVRDPKINPMLYRQYRNIYNSVKMVERDNDTRQLWIVHESLRYDVIKYFKSDICVEMQDYDGEYVMFVNEINTHWIYDWIWGLPHKIRRGYEMIKQNPVIVIIFYSGVVELAHLKRKYPDIVDKWYSEGEVISLESEETTESD